MKNKIKELIKGIIVGLVIGFVLVAMCKIIIKSEKCSNEHRIEYEKKEIVPVEVKEEVEKELGVVVGVIREVTMYTSTPEQTDGSPCIGASTEDQCVLWRNGQDICATNAFRKDDVLCIDKLGCCLVKDAMNSRYKNRIDWYAGYDDECLDGVDYGDNCPNYKRAVDFGIQLLAVNKLN